MVCIVVNHILLKIDDQLPNILSCEGLSIPRFKFKTDLGQKHSETLVLN